MRRHWSACIALVLCLSVTACGSRLNDEQRERVLGAGQGNGNGGAGSGNNPGGGGDLPGGGGNTGGGGGTGGDSGNGPPAAKACQGTGGATDKGVTANKIKVANVSDISGPVAGLFESAQAAVKAYVAYVNASGGVCGRTLDLMSLDSRTDSRGDQEGALKACNEAFAMIGSMSAYDQGGASQVSSCGIPDIRAVSTTAQRQRSATSFAASSNKVNLRQAAVADYFKAKYPAAVSKAAFLYLNTEVTKQNEQSFAKAFATRGYTWVYEQAIDVADFNYSPYVVQMKEKGVKYVQWLGSAQHAARLLQAMKQQGFKPDAFVMDPVAYDANFVKQAGDAANGVSMFTDTILMEDGGNKELDAYRTWLARVAPKARPDYFGFFAWGAAKLFVELIAKIGPNLTRAALLSAVKNVHDYTGGGLFSAQDVGGKRTPKCWQFARLSGGKWSREAGYKCGAIVDTGVGG